MTHWPPFDLAVRTPRVELRGATDEVREELVALLDRVMSDEEAPFDDPFSLYEAPPQRVRVWMQRQWGMQANLSPDDWRLYFAVIVDGRAVGMQDLGAQAFPALRTVHTFSWLVRGARGRGIGTEMRSAVLHLAFAGLDAIRATSEAFVDNDGSNGVSRALGYEPNGTSWATRRGEPGTMQRWLLTRDAWALRRRDDIEIVGLEACRGLLGA